MRTGLWMRSKLNNMPFPKIISHSFSALGTTVDVQIVARSVEELEKIKCLFQDIETKYASYQKMLSRFDSESELSKINETQGFVEVSPVLKEIAEKSLSYYLETSGMFDPRILGVLESVGYDRTFTEIHESQKKEFSENLSTPLSHDLSIEGKRIHVLKRIDFSGIAKGYITDKIAEYVYLSGFHDFIVDSGGDMFMSGKNHDGKLWTIGIEGAAKSLVFAVERMGVATSGITRRKWTKGIERFHHLVNPINPAQFDFNLKTVTVIAESTEKADVWAKVLYLHGIEKGMHVANEKGIPCIFLDYRGNSWLSTAAKIFQCK